MKTKVLSLGVAVISFIFMASCGSSTADKKNQENSTERIEASFEVKGSCDMCETRIEKAAKSVEGVATADWNQETEILEVSFDESKTSEHKVQMAIAKVGHDTPMHKATDEVYDALPGCCKYDRTEVKKEGADHEGQKH